MTSPTYEHLKTLLGKKSSKVTHVGSCHTSMNIDADGVIRVHMIATDIITAYPTGLIVLDVGEDLWFTPTTKSRLNEFLANWRVFQEKGKWYVHDMTYSWEQGQNTP